MTTEKDAKLMAEVEELAEELAKRYARELGGFPRGTSLIAVNGHTRGWDDCMKTVAQPLRGEMKELRLAYECLQSGMDIAALTAEKDALAQQAKKFKHDNYLLRADLTELLVATKSLSAVQRISEARESAEQLLRYIREGEALAKHGREEG